MITCYCTEKVRQAVPGQIDQFDGAAREIELGCPVEALGAFRQAIRLNPDFSIAYHNLGITLAEQGQASGAAACFVEFRPIQ